MLREPQGTRGAHLKHVAHVRDAGRVEAQRLVEGVRVLPSQMQGIRSGARCGTGGGTGGGRAWGRGGGNGASGMHGEQMGRA